jgi:hypothetical protein
VADPFVEDSIAVPIAQGASLSAQVDIGGKTLVGIFVPALWAAAGLSFQASPDGGATWGELQDTSATALSVSTITISGGVPVFIAVDPTKWRGIRSLKVRSGTAAAPVNQTNSGGVSLQLLIREIF